MSTDNLKNKVVVVLGSTGVVGEGVVKNLLNEGSIVVGTSRNEKKLNVLKEKFRSDNFIPVVAAWGNAKDGEQSIESIKNAISKDHQIDHVVISLGFVKTKDVPSETSLEFLDDVIRDGFYPNVIAASAFVKLFKKQDTNASITLVGGGFSHGLYGPGTEKIWTGTLKNNLTNSLQIGLATELANSKIRVNTICIHFPVSREGEKKNQMGMDAPVNNSTLGKVFVKTIVDEAKKGELICVNPQDVN